ncbi:hypothetical protein [Lutibacter sp.]
MDVQAKRLELVKWILGVQEEVLNKVSLIKENSSKEIVAYSVNEEPLSEKTYIKKVKDAEQRIDSGEYTSHNNLGEEMQNW